MALARRAALAYARNAKLAALTLLTETVLLAEARTDADVSAFREELSQRRQAINPPRPGR